MRLIRESSSASPPGEDENRINLIKLCVGAHSVRDLERWQRARFRDSPPFHLTRMRPKRISDILNGGSLYWVIDGYIQARQLIVDLDSRMCADGIRRCAIVFEAEIIRTRRQPRRPFQGWRYLKPEDSPDDLPPANIIDDELPEHLAAQLDSIGVVPLSQPSFRGGSDSPLNNR